MTESRHHLFLGVKSSDLSAIIVKRSSDKNVVAHEKAHIRRLDYLWKPLGYVLFAVYWFNPFCWLAYILFCRDIEMACDERVIKEWSAEQKKRVFTCPAFVPCAGKNDHRLPVSIWRSGCETESKKES